MNFLIVNIKKYIGFKNRKTCGLGVDVGKSLDLALDSEDGKGLDFEWESF